MAGFTRTNGDLQPVAVMDSGVTANSAGTNDGVNVLGGNAAAANGATVQMWGPKLNFFTIADANLEPVTQAVGNAVTAIFQTVQQLSTICIYEYTDTGSNGNIAIALFDTGAQTAASLQTAIQALGANAGGSGIDLTAAVVANGATFTAVA